MSKSLSAHECIQPCSSLFFIYVHIVICGGHSWCPLETADFNGLFVTRSFARLPGCSKSSALWGQRQMMQIEKLFSSFPRCQHVLSWFWRGFPRVGIQRCNIPLIRLFCHAPLHLSSAYCSSERERKRKDVGWARWRTPPCIPVRPAPDCQTASVWSRAVMMAPLNVNHLSCNGWNKKTSSCSNKSREKIQRDEITQRVQLGSKLRIAIPQKNYGH